MHKIASPHQLQSEIRQIIASLPHGCSRAKVAQVLEDLAERTSARRIAGSKSYNDYLKEADREFLREVAKQITSVQKHCQAKADDSPGGSTIFLTLTGEDSSDMPIDGYATLIHTGHFEVRFDLDLDTVNGKVQEEKVFKIGVLTTDLAAKIILQHLRFQA